MIGPPSVSDSGRPTRVVACEREIRERIREGFNGPASSPDSGTVGYRERTDGRCHGSPGLGHNTLPFSAMWPAAGPGTISAFWCAELNALNEPSNRMEGLS